MDAALWLTGGLLTAVVAITIVGGRHVMRDARLDDCVSLIVIAAIVAIAFYLTVAAVVVSLIRLVFNLF
jgi:hypothetical protein